MRSRAAAAVGLALLAAMAGCRDRAATGPELAPGTRSTVSPHPMNADALAASRSAASGLRYSLSGTSGAIVGNGVVQLGINPFGELNVGGGTASSGTGTTVVGLRYVATNADAISPGCLCEGWGVADVTTGAKGYANRATGTAGLTSVSFVADATTATSVVTAANILKVTHQFSPSAATANLYEIVVTVENISTSAVDLRYRRVLDWDVEPTAFNEFVTIQGKATSSNVLFTSNNGFASADPLSGQTDLGHTGDFVDAGPKDHGALIDLAFGSLAAGASKTFKLYYGAAASEVGAQAALTAVGAEFYSFGQPSGSSPTEGTPNTFVIAATGVGGTALTFNQPPTISSTGGPYVGAKGQSITFTGTASDPDGDALTYTWNFGDQSAPATGQTVTHAYASNGKFPVTLTVSDGKGGTATATTTAAIGHEIAVNVQSPDGTTGVVVVTATRTSGTEGEYYVQETDANGSTTFFLSDGGWLFHARNLPDRGDPNGGFFFPVSPIPDGQREIRTSENRNRVGVLYDHTVSPAQSIVLTPANYEKLTVSPFTLSGGGRLEPYPVALSFPTGFTLAVTLKDENGNDVSVVDPSTDLATSENAFIILPHRDGATLPPRPSGAPGFGLQRGILLLAGTFQPGGAAAQDGSIAGIPSLSQLPAAPVLETNTVTITNDAGHQQQVQFIKPFFGTEVVAVAEPARDYVDYIKDPWGDNKQDGDIGLVSYGWVADAAGNATDVFAPAAHVRGNSKYILQVRYFVNGSEQTIKVAVTWDETAKKWVLLEKATTPSTLPTGFVVHDPTGYGVGTGATFEGTVIFRLTLPGVNEVEFRVIARDEGASDAAPNTGYRKAQKFQFTWDTFGEE